MSDDSGWSKERPRKQGWYFWKRHHSMVDQFYMEAYYVLEEGSLAESNLTCWLHGTCVDWPESGLWKMNSTDLRLD